MGGDRRRHRGDRRRRACCPLSGPGPTRRTSREPASIVATPDAESSAWYCTGQTTAAGQLAPGSVVLTNTGSRPGVRDAPRRDGQRCQGADLRLRRRARAGRDGHSRTQDGDVALRRGQLDRRWCGRSRKRSHGPSGWAESPCQSSTSQQWYFPSGVTTGSNALVPCALQSDFDARRRRRQLRHPQGGGPPHQFPGHRLAGRRDAGGAREPVRAGAGERRHHREGADGPARGQRAPAVLR